MAGMTTPQRPKPLDFDAHLAIFERHGASAAVIGAAVWVRDTMALARSAAASLGHDDPAFVVAIYDRMLARMLAK